MTRNSVKIILVDGKVEICRTGFVAKPHFLFERCLSQTLFSNFWNQICIAPTTPKMDSFDKLNHGNLKLLAIRKTLRLQISGAWYRHCINYENIKPGSKC